MLLAHAIVVSVCALQAYLVQGEVVSRKKKSPPVIPWTVDRALKRAERSGLYTRENLRDRALELLPDASLKEELARYINREETSLDPQWPALLDMLLPAARRDRTHLQSVWERLSAYPPNAALETLMAQLLLDNWGELLCARRHALTAIRLAPGLCWPYYTSGLIHMHMGAPERSRADHAKAAERCGPMDLTLRARALHNQAVVWVNYHRDYAAARQLAVQALESWPDYPEGKELLARLAAFEGGAP